MRAKKSKQKGCVVRVGDWWVLRHRERVSRDGRIIVLNRAKRICEVGPNCRTKAQARKLAKDMTGHIDERSKADAAHVITLGEFVEQHFLPHVRRTFRPSTANEYTNRWHAYLAPRCADWWIRDVKTSHVQELLYRIASEHETGLSRTTLQHTKHLLSGIFTLAEKLDFLDAKAINPAQKADIPGCAREPEETHAYSLDEVRTMLTLFDDPMKTIVAVAAFSGLRENEIRGLEWTDYEPAADEDSLGLLFVRRSYWRNHVNPPKTKKSKAPVPVIPWLAQFLSEYRAACGNPKSGPMFASRVGTALSLDSLYTRKMKDVIAKAGLVWHGWHAFRRGLATTLNRLLVDDSVTQRILRHSTVQVTQNAYIQTLPADAVDAMRRFSEKCSQLVLKNGPETPSEPSVVLQ